jgi:hypothetical protein
MSLDTSIGAIELGVLMGTLCGQLPRERVLDV